MTNHNTSRVRLHPVNTAEAVIMPFFDPGLSPEQEWVLESGVGTRELRLGATYSTHISWESATPGVPAFTWRWAGRLDVGDFDGFFLQASLASSARVRFQARLDGVWQAVREVLRVSAREAGLRDVYFGFIVASHRPEDLPHIARNLRVCCETMNEFGGP